MTDSRKWRDAKLPQWVRDQIDAELVAASLAWPTEAEPKPMPFRWGQHGGCENHDQVVPGIYWFEWSKDGPPRQVEIAVELGGVVHRFEGRSNFSMPYVRAPLYASPRDVILARLWRECREAAKKLHVIRSKL